MSLVLQPELEPGVAQQREGRPPGSWGKLTAASCFTRLHLCLTSRPSSTKVPKHLLCALETLPLRTRMPQGPTGRQLAPEPSLLCEGQALTAAQKGETVPGAEPTGQLGPVVMSERSSQGCRERPDAGEA